ncbi:hypothetical protein Tsubulata_035754 [Turnera subulata]|uniref:Uncharacterized protein n=1 Tax=Turnera subulata TaxID=218843 RepID=A0A9Q0J6K9_9ROSI|nr:hypothetical protein Tsubulata_035754 [Turnera subulata]
MSRKEAMILLVFLVFQYSIILVQMEPLAPALYVFGDSMVDNGNNNFLPTTARANFSPYGVDFFVGGDIFVGKATGRFTNGRTIPDVIAEFLHIPYPPPYMNISKHSSPIPLSGLNYASASCGLLPETGRRFGKCLSLDDQINLFEQTVAIQLPKHFKSPNEVSEYLSKSLFVVSVGNDDYTGNYLQAGYDNTSKQYSPEAFAQLLVDKLSKKFEKLYSLGARKVVSMEIGPLGCFPAFRKADGTCDENINELVSYFNQKLHVMLQDLTSSLHGSIFVHTYVYRSGQNTIKDPAPRGVGNVTDACCVTRKDGTSGCVPSQKPCSDRSGYYFFDGLHLTEYGYSTIASLCFTSDYMCSPRLFDVIGITG